MVISIYNQLNAYIMRYYMCATKYAKWQLLSLTIIMKSKICQLIIIFFRSTKNIPNLIHYFHQMWWGQVTTTTFHNNRR